MKNRLRLSSAPGLPFNMALSVGLGLSALLTAPTAQAQTDQAQTAKFTDVSTDYWADEYIEGLADLNVIRGFPDGTFRPDQPVTRAQFAAILQQAFLQSQTASAQPFVDIPANYWAGGAIAASRSAGFLAGYPGNVFRPEQTIPRVEALVSLANGLKYEAASPEALSTYRNADVIPAYALPGVVAAEQANIVVNYPDLDNIAPYQPTTRAEAAAFIYQALVKEGRATPLTLPASDWPRESAVTIPVVAQQIGLSNSGRQLVALTSAGDMIQVRNTQTGELQREIVADGDTRYIAAAISDDGTKVVAIARTISNNALQLSLWNAQTGEQLWQKPLGATVPGQLPDPDQNIGRRLSEVAFRPGDGMIFTRVDLKSGANNGTTDAQLRLYDTATGKIVRSLEATPGSESIQFEFSPNGAFLAGAGYAPLAAGELARQTLIDVWRLSDGNQIHTLRPTAEESLYYLMDMVFTANNALNVFTQLLYDVHLDTWNVQTGERTARKTDVPDIDRQENFGRLSPDGEYYFVRSDVAGTRLINLKTSEIRRLDTIAFAADFSDGGDYLAIATDQNVLILTKAKP